MTLKGGTRGSFLQADLLNNARTVWLLLNDQIRQDNMWGGRISRGGGSSKPLPHRGGAQAQHNFGGSLFAYILWRLQNYQIWRGKTHGRGLVLGVSHVPIKGGVVPALPILGGSFLFMRTSFVAELQNWTWEHAWEGACILGSVTLSIPREWSSRAFQFWGYSVFMPTLFNTERPNSAW